MATSNSSHLPQEIKELISWSTSQGATLHPKAEVYVDPIFGVSLRVKPSQYSNSTDTLVQNGDKVQTKGHSDATNDLPAESTIVSCPFTTSLSFANAFNSFGNLPSRTPILPEQFLKSQPPKVIGVFFLMQHYVLDEKSFWGPYIKSLPQPDEAEKLATPLYWPKSDLECIQGTNLAAATEARKKQWDEEYDTGREEIGDAWKTHFEDISEERGRELYKWASTIFSSRSFVSTLIPPEVYGHELDNVCPIFRNVWRSYLKKIGPYPVLFPLLDIANHDPKTKVLWFTDAQSETKTVSIKAESPVPAGQQIFNNYAPKQNTELLLGYGFMLPDNDDTAIEFRVEDDWKNDVLREQREEREVQRSDDEEAAMAKGRYIYHLRSEPYNNGFVLHGGQGVKKTTALRIFEPGFIDTLAVVGAIEREEEWIQHHMSWSAEEYIFGQNGTMVMARRDVIAGLTMLKHQLVAKIKRLAHVKEALGQRDAKTPFTSTAEAYRDGQVSVIEMGVKAINAYLGHWMQPVWTREYQATELERGAACGHSRGSKDPCLICTNPWPRKPIVDIRAAWSYLDKMWNFRVYKHIRRVLEDLAEEEISHKVRSEVSWALWITIILCLAADKRQDFTDALDVLCEWADLMVEGDERWSWSRPYPLRPLPKDNDEAYAMLKKCIAGFNTFTCYAVLSEDEEEHEYPKTFMPMEDEIKRWNNKKPRLKIGEDWSPEEKEKRCRVDFFEKMAVLGLKIAKGECVEGFGGGVASGSQSVLVFRWPGMNEGPGRLNRSKLYDNMMKAAILEG